MSRRPPSLDRLLAEALDGESRPPAFVLAGHNGSGKSTLWYERLANKVVPWSPTRGAPRGR